MKRWKKRLATLLILQLALAGGIWALSRNRMSGAMGSKLIAGFERSKVDNIQISGSGKTIPLQKKPEGWRLPEYHNLPVDMGKLNGLLDQLERLEGTDFVSQTSESQARFQVSDDEPSGRLQLKAGQETIADLLLGKNAALDKKYVRIKGRPEIYSVAFRDFGFLSDASAWFDRTLLQPGELQSVTLGALRLEKGEKGWTGNGKPLKDDEVGKLIDSLRNLTVLAAEPATTPNSPLAIDLKTSTGKSMSLKLFTSEGKWFLESENYEVAFQVADSWAQTLRETKLESLLSNENKPSETK